MARITVEDCLTKMNNRFDLTLLAAKRARHLLMSADEPFVPWENDKATVVALREIAGGFVTAETIRQQELASHADGLASAEDMLAQAASSIAKLEEVHIETMQVSFDEDDTSLTLSDEPGEDH